MFAISISLSLHVYAAIINLTRRILYLSRTRLNNESVKNSLYDNWVSGGRNFEDSLTLDLIIHKRAFEYSAIFEYHYARTITHILTKIAFINVAVGVDHPSCSILHSILEGTFKFWSSIPWLHFIVCVLNKVPEALSPWHNRRLFEVSVSKCLKYIFRIRPDTCLVNEAPTINVNLFH